MSVINETVKFNDTIYDVSLEETIEGSRIKFNSNKDIKAILITLTDDYNDYFIRCFGKTGKNNWDMGRYIGPISRQMASDWIKDKFKFIINDLKNHKIPTFM
jgi:hypothetical protein